MNRVAFGVFVLVLPTAAFGQVVGEVDANRYVGSPVVLGAVGRASSPRSTGTAAFGAVSPAFAPAHADARGAHRLAGSRCALDLPGS